MLRAKTAILAMVVVVMASGLSPAADKAKLDDAFAKLAAYDFGRDSTATTTIAGLVTASHGNAAERQDLANRLAGILKSNAPRGAKDCACRQLSIIGTEAEVPVLAALLTDENLSHMARYALERIPGSAAPEALRQSLGKVKGKTLVGVINSLGDRRFAGATDDLVKLLADSDVAVAQAAAVALGKIGPAGCPALEKALENAPANVRPTVAQALVLCAESLMAQGKRDQAAALYDRLLAKSDVKSVRMAAARGAALARRSAPSVVALLKGNDSDLFLTGLVLVREMRGGKVAKAVAAELASLPPEKQVLVVEALADRRDRAATPAVLTLAGKGDVKVRVAAIRALTKLGDASVVPVFVGLATGGEAELSQAAVAGLANLAGKNVDAAIQGVLANPDVKARRVAIDALGQRRVAAAGPALLKAAADADPGIRLAAAKALGETVTCSDLPGLIELLVGAKVPADMAALEAALAIAAARMPDREACAQIVASAVPAADVHAKAALLRTMGRVGGAKALDAVRASLKDNAEEVRETAIRVLTEWTDAAAIADLASLAKTSPAKTHKILALRGYIRLIGLSAATPDQKLAQCKDAMSLADRIEEKKLVLGALGHVPSAEALAIVAPFVDNPATKDEAAAAAVAIGEQIVAGHGPQTAAVMKKVLQATANPDLKKRAQDVVQRAGGK